MQTWNYVVLSLTCCQAPIGGYDAGVRAEYMRRRAEGTVEGPVEGKWLHLSLVKFEESYKVIFRRLNSSKHNDFFATLRPLKT